MSDELKADAEGRRQFLKAAGKFAVIVPPTMTFLLATTLNTDAIAKSEKCNSGRGNGSEPDPNDDCDPGNSGGHNNGGD